jgi:hypothetical protein
MKDKKLWEKIMGKWMKIFEKKVYKCLVQVTASCLYCLQQFFFLNLLLYALTFLNFNPYPCNTYVYVLIVNI